MLGVVGRFRGEELQDHQCLTCSRCRLSCRRYGSLCTCPWRGWAWTSRCSGRSQTGRCKHTGRNMFQWKFIQRTICIRVPPQQEMSGSDSLTSMLLFVQLICVCILMEQIVNSCFFSQLTCKPELISIQEQHGQVWVVSINRAAKFRDQYTASGVWSFWAFEKVYGLKKGRRALLHYTSTCWANQYQHEWSFHQHQGTRVWATVCLYLFFNTEKLLRSILALGFTKSEEYLNFWCGS